MRSEMYEKSMRKGNVCQRKNTEKKVKGNERANEISGDVRDEPHPFFKRSPHLDTLPTSDLCYFILYE